MAFFRILWRSSAVFQISPETLDGQNPITARHSPQLNAAILPIPPPVPRAVSARGSTRLHSPVARSTCRPHEKRSATARSLIARSLPDLRRPRRFTPPRARQFRPLNPPSPSAPSKWRTREPWPTKNPATAGFSAPQTPPPPRGSKRVRDINPHLPESRQHARRGLDFAPKKWSLLPPFFRV